jgi:hypothetical protein
MQIHLHIAGYRIRMEEPNNYPSLAWPMSPFDRFLAEPFHTADINLGVRIVRELPVLARGSVHFDACHGLWTLFESEAGFILECLDTQTLRPRILAALSPDYSTVQAFVLEQDVEGMTGWVPMQVLNPIVELCLVTRVSRGGGIVLHSAGVLSPQGGYIFTGASGAGKSTLARLFAERGASVLSDERMIVRRSGSGVVAYGTPWVGSGQYAKNVSGHVTGLYCIRHGTQSHRIETISPGAIMSVILQQCFLPHWDREAMDSTLAFLSDVIQRVPCRSLAFLKQPDIVDYLYHQSANLSLVSP